MLFHLSIYGSLLLFTRVHVTTEKNWGSYGFITLGDSVVFVLFAFHDFDV